ncbi:HAD family hydrolase [Candidatus Neomarinimicrobiota bacterium]
MNSTKNIAAFFDFDRTLITVSSGQLGFKWLREHNMLTSWFKIQLGFFGMLYKHHLIHELTMMRTFLKFYKGRVLADFQATGPEFWQLYLKPHLSGKVMKKVEYHRTNGHILVLNSGTLRYILDPVATDIGFEHVLCTDLEVGSDGLMTGKADGPICIGENKRKYLLDLTNEHNIDLEISYAYSDHHSDVPLLESVGNPIVVEPTAILQKIAEERSWPILNHFQ